MMVEAALDSGGDGAYMALMLLIGWGMAIGATMVREVDERGIESFLIPLPAAYVALLLRIRIFGWKKLPLLPP